MARLDEGAGPSVVAKKKKKPLPTPDSLVQTTVRRLEASISSVPDVKPKQKVAKRQSTEKLPNSNEDSASSLRASQSPSSTFTPRSPVKKKPAAKKAPTNNMGDATPATPVRNHSPKKHHPKSLLSPTAATLAPSVPLTPTTPLDRGVQRSVSASNTILPSGRTSPAVTASSTSSSPTKRPNSPQHAIGRVEPASRGMKRYSSMPNQSTSAAAKSKTEKRQESQGAEVGRGLRGLLGSIREQSPSNMSPKGSPKKKATTVNHSPKLTDSTSNGRGLGSQLADSIRKLPFLNPTSGTENIPPLLIGQHSSMLKDSSGRISPRPTSSRKGSNQSSSPKPPTRTHIGSKTAKTAPSSPPATTNSQSLSAGIFHLFQKIPFLNHGNESFSEQSEQLASDRASLKPGDDTTPAGSSGPVSSKPPKKAASGGKLKSPKKSSSGRERGIEESPLQTSKKTKSKGGVAKANTKSPRKNKASKISSKAPEASVADTAKAGKEKNLTASARAQLEDEELPIESYRQPRRGSRLDFLRANNLIDSTSPSANKEPTPAELALKKPESLSQLNGVSSQRPTSGRRLVARAQSSDLEYMRPAQERETNAAGFSDKPRQISRSQSGDLELFPESSMHVRTGIEAAPSILKNSSHNHQSILRNSSHHARSFVPRRDTHARARFPENVCSDDDDSSIEETTIVFDDSPSTKPHPSRPGLGPRQSSRPGLKRGSSHSFGFSTRSLMSQDKEEVFPDDPLWKRALRYIRILPPHPDEKLERKRIRIYIWYTLLLDFIAALVSITTYHGVTTCCGVPIFSLEFVDVDWSKAIRITTYVYLAMIFCEIIPVVRKGLPFNLINPMVGFTITFAMFFDDRVVGAVIMWIIEAAAIYCEFLTYRLQSKIYHDRYDRLDAVEKDLKPYISSRTLNVSKRKINSGHSRRNSTLNSGGSGASSDEDSVSGHSFGDDDNDPEEQLNDSFGLPKSSNHKLRKARLLRERRMLRQRQAGERLHLRYHLGGVVINFGLICISFILIVVIASSGGLCIRSDFRPVVFDMNQLEKCGACKDKIVDGKCEVCTSEEEMQCYYQYI